MGSNPTLSRQTGIGNHPPERRNGFMSYMLVRLQVSDYAKWRSVFDEHEPTRKAAGSKGSHVLHRRRQSE